MLDVVVWCSGLMGWILSFVCGVCWNRCGSVILMLWFSVV